MSSHDNKRQTSTSVTTTTATETVRQGHDLGVLTPEEEKVLRMLHGLSEEDTHELKFALGADKELRARLALLESYLLDLFSADQLDETLMDEIRALKSDIDADESPTLERRVYSNDEAAEEAEQHDDALASAPELEAGTAAAPNENAQWVTSMQIAVDKNLKGDIVAGFNLKPLTGAGAGAGATGTGGHFVSPATALGASWERTQQNHAAGAGAGVTRPTELVRFPVTLNTPLKAAGAEYWDLSAHEGKAGMRYHMKGGDTHFYKLRAAKELPGQRLAVVFSSRESSAANPSLERDEDGNVVASPAEELGIQWGHDADGYVGTDGTDASAADEPHEEHGDEHGASLLPPGLERLGGGRNALAFSVSQLEQKMGGKKIPGGYSRFTMVATPGARRRPRCPPSTSPAAARHPRHPRL